MKLEDYVKKLPQLFSRVLKLENIGKNIPVYSNNTTAKEGGLIKGDYYHTGDGVVKVVLD